MFTPAELKLAKIFSCLDETECARLAQVAADVADAVPILAQYQADAITVASASISEMAARNWAKHKYPVLLFNRHVARVSLPAICSDHSFSRSRT